MRAGPSDFSSCETCDFLNALYCLVTKFGRMLDDAKWMQHAHGAGVVANYPTGGVFVVLGGNLGFSVLASATSSV